jgi:hypothetical protein
MREGITQMVSRILTSIQEVVRFEVTQQLVHDLGLAS